MKRNNNLLLFYITIGILLCFLYIPLPLSANQTECSVVEPEGYEQDQELPVLIALRGGGGTAKGFAKFLKPYADKYNYLIICPSLPKTMFPNIVTAKAKDILDAIEQTLEKYRIQKDKIFILGFSFSTPAVFKIVSLKPDIFKGIVICAPSTLPENKDILNDKLKKLHFYIVQGKKDPLGRTAKSLNTLLKKHGYKNVLFKQIPNLKHQFPKERDIAEIFKWAKGLNQSVSEKTTSAMDE